MTIPGTGRDSGVAAVALVVVIAWALTAVLLLTQTLVAARQIDERVDVIRSEVGSVDLDLDDVALLEDTTRVADDIRDAAAPLSGQLDAVIAAAQSIDRRVASIEGTANAINRTVNDIGGSARSINSHVRAILASLQGVLDAARSIDSGVEGINRRADTVIELVRWIRSDVGNVLGQVLDVHRHANSIDCSPAVRLQSQRCGAHPDDG